MQTTPPVVVNTWPFSNATDAAWEVLITKALVDGVHLSGTAVSAVVAGCSVAEEDRNIKSVGYGTCPDEEGHTTLDALVMDGRTMEAGAVGAMPDIHEATQVAREVMLSTRHTLLVGPHATEFAKSRGFAVRSLDTPESHELWQKWRDNKCQPNFRKSGAWIPDPSTCCGPYRPNFEMNSTSYSSQSCPKTTVQEDNHDTIGMIALDAYGSMAVGVSTSGLRHKIPGRVGDTPVPGAGGYVDNEVGGAVGTGDGDVLMRFLLSFQAVQLMRSGLGPTAACEKSLQTVRQAGTWRGGLVALTKTGEYGAACHGFEKFEICVRSDSTGNATKIIPIPCMLSMS
ncbi:unnamed protein product [Calicophoron daubneyi]|uniref:N(4)-(Beta-N-acetylglucosaminyl)-L-asparaginase n=1 Tax=Calicophoron daubneyi TaxID=300641 RepID=A0AAV2TAV3_CALDB